MGIFKRRDKQEGSALYYFMQGNFPSGYTRLADAPEVAACVDRIASIIAASTIYLMKNTPQGDVREVNRLSRLVDIDPWPNLATRASWLNWIVSTLLTVGDGNAFVLPHSVGGEFVGLEPMPQASAVPDDETGYKISWRGRTYEPDDVLHFRLGADLNYPWRGQGVRVQAERVAQSLAQTDALKQSLSSPEYKPPLIVMVNADSELSDEAKRAAFRDSYIGDTDAGKPWILPAELMQVEQVKPLSLTDLAVKDTVELDKKTVASIFGVPAFLLGVGSYSADEFNNFIRTKIIPICTGIEQELTLKLLVSDKLYFKFNRKRLYAYDMVGLVSMGLSMSDRGFMTGDEVRSMADYDPAGLDEYHALENFIPWDMAANQSKLIQTGGDGNA